MQTHPLRSAVLVNIPQLQACATINSPSSLGVRMLSEPDVQIVTSGFRMQLHIKNPPPRSALLEMIDTATYVSFPAYTASSADASESIALLARLSDSLMISSTDAQPASSHQWRRGGTLLVFPMAGDWCR